MKEKSPSVGHDKVAKPSAVERADTVLPSSVGSADTVLPAATDIAKTLPSADTAKTLAADIAKTLPSADKAKTLAADIARTLPSADIAKTLAADIAKTSRAQLSSSSVPLPVRDRSRYKFRSEIARGGMGRIVSVRDLELGRDLAIKEQLKTSATLNQRFDREIRITSRLQHPAIITALDAGCWPGGELFFTMKHVDAQPFDVVIEARKTLSERLALLPNLIAVVEALAYAHDHQIIHRDLKPANVLIGSFGETVVIDWGLAKDLSAGEPDEAFPIASSDSSDKLTMFGEAMGTPAYMPPEQAKGTLVDQRADVYALGAMLYHLLTGNAPYEDSEATSAQQVLNKVKADAPTPLTEIEGKAPPDLLAIVDKAMARSVDQRYPSALELAQDLRRFAAGQLVVAHRYSMTALLIRWVNKHRAAVAVGVVMGIALIVGGIIGVRSIARERDLARQERQQAQLERMLAEEQRTLAEQQGQKAKDQGHKAEEQRKEAEKHHSNAEELMQVILVDLYDKLEPIGQADILDVVFDKAGNYYENQDLDYSRPDDADRRAIFYESAADLMISRDKEPKALELFQSALVIRTRLAELDPDGDWLEDLAELHMQTADFLFKKYKKDEKHKQKKADKKDKAAALKHFKLAVQTEARIGESARYFERLGYYQEAKGDFQDAFKSYAAAIALLKTSRPEDSGAPDLAMMHIQAANVLDKNGDTIAAVKYQRIALGLHAALAQEHPGSAHRYGCPP